jgi:hypothetical protein
LLVVGGDNRHQTYFSSLEAQVTADNPVRLMDAFVEKLELEKLGFTHTVHKSEGRPPYAPAVFLKLNLYADLRSIYYPIALFAYGTTVYSVVAGKEEDCKNYKNNERHTYPNKPLKPCFENVPVAKPAH